MLGPLWLEIKRRLAPDIDKVWTRYSMQIVSRKWTLIVERKTRSDDREFERIWDWSGDRA